MSGSKIQKWGNSMALRIPAVTMRAWGIEEGQTVALKIEDGALVVKPAQPRYTLTELLDQCDFSEPQTASDREWLEAPLMGLEDD
jgi:antitoxin ChpS